MESVKKFIVEHKKELALATTGILIYRMGFNRGFNSAKNAISHVFNEASRTLPVRF